MVLKCVWRGRSAWVLLLLLINLTWSQALRRDCPIECISLKQCPSLSQLLKNPTAENIRILREATCSIIGNKPLVCCLDNTPSTTTTTQKPAIMLPQKCGASYDLNRIHGGSQVPVGGHPWMAVLGYTEIGFPETRFLCGGSIINERYILTAAHCVDQSALKGRKLEIVRVGEWNLADDRNCDTTRQGTERCAPPAQDFPVEEIVPHSAYDTRADFSDDIALIRLNRTIDLSGIWVHPVCLPPQGLNIKQIIGERQALTAGFGFTEKGKTSDRLLHVSLPLRDHQTCNTTYKGEVINEQLCLGGRAGQDSCSGDSGGPVVVSGPRGPPYLQIGVVSYGPVSCGLEGVPGVYTSVSSYRNWIDQNVKP